MKNLNKIMTLALLTISFSPVVAMIAPNHIIADVIKPNIVNLTEQKLSELLKALQGQDHATVSSIISPLSRDEKNDLLQTALTMTELNYELIKLLLDRGAILHMDMVDSFIQADNADFIKFLIDHQITAQGCWINYSFASQESGPTTIIPSAIAHNAFNILNYLFENNHITNITKRESLERTYKISQAILSFLLEHGAHPSKYVITNFISNNMLPEAELCLQNPTVTREMKNELFSNFLKENCHETILELFIKNGVQVSEENLITAIKSQNVTHIKLLLKSGAVKPTKQAVNAATALRACPQEILDLLLDHDAPIPIAAQRAILHHSAKTDIHPKILSVLLAECKRIKAATDLDDGQKETLLAAFSELNLNEIFNDKNYKSIDKIPYLNISDQLLAKYFPLGIWINEQHDKFNKCTKDNADEHYGLGDKCAGFFQNNQAKPNLTLTEQLFINLASQRIMLGENAIFPGKDPKENIQNNPETNKNYYEAGFAGDFFKSNILPQIIKAEQELNAQGFQTFFHARFWQWNFANDIWNLLCKLKTNESNQGKISLRFRDPKNINIEKLLEYRRDLVKNGTPKFTETCSNRTGKEAEVTYMNVSALSNPAFKGECTATYYNDNRSIGPIDAVWNQIENMFKFFELESYYEQLKPEMEALFNQHAETNNFGELVCFGIKEEYLNEMVYPAQPGGKRIPGNATEHIKICKEGVLNSKNFHDTNHTIYLFAASDIPGEYDIKYKTKSLHLADPKKYAAYKQALDAFAAKLKAYLQTSAQE